MNKRKKRKRTQESNKKRKEERGKRKDRENKRENEKSEKKHKYLLSIILGKTSERRPGGKVFISDEKARDPWPGVKRIKGSLG